MLCTIKIKQTKQQKYTLSVHKTNIEKSVYPKYDPSKVLLCACGGIVTSFFSVHVPVRQDDDSRYIRCFIPVYNVPSIFNKNHVYIVIL